MGFIFKGLFLLGCYQLWDRFHKPFFCGLAYALVMPFLGLLYGMTSSVRMTYVLGMVIIELPLAWGFFEALERTEGSENWFLILLGGMLFLFFDFLWLNPLVKFLGI